MARQSIFDMKVSKIYPLLLQKVERKGRSKEELDTAIKWLTGYDMDQVDQERQSCEYPRGCLLSEIVRMYRKLQRLYFRLN